VTVKNSSTKNMPASPAKTNVVYCTLARRLMVILYDSFAVLAIFFLLTAIWVIGNSGEAITQANKLYPLYILSLGISAWIYCALSWRRGGLTLGMRAWKVQLVTEDGNKISWGASLLRFCSAWLGMTALAGGFLISLFRKDRACWQDLLSHSRLIRQSFQ